MSSIIDRINDDMDDYVRRCEKYGEKVQISPPLSGQPHCYGEHATKLEEREKAEADAARKVVQHTADFELETALARLDGEVG
jgi:hypothetical protein